MAFDKATDLALVRITSGYYHQPLPKGYRFPAIPLGDPAKMEIGDTVTTLGFPEIGSTTGRGSVTLTRGVISGFEKTEAGLLMKADWGALDAEAYTRQYRHEPVSTEYPQLMLFNMIDTLGQAIVWMPLTGAGSADSRGLEAALRAHWHSRAHLLLSATRSQSQYRALDGILRTGNYDTPVAINAMTNIQLPWRIALNGGSLSRAVAFTLASISPIRSRKTGAFTI